MNVVDNNDKHEELLDRGVETIYPNRDFLKQKLESGEKLTVYLGFDPTSPTLHLGHVIQLNKLKTFQDLGHEVILLVGDFTGMIGDPTDKTEARVQLTKEEVLFNKKKYKKQSSKVLKFTGENAAEFKHNSKWLSKINLESLLSIASKLTVGQLLKRDMFAERMNSGLPVYLHEFLYPLMQGYDSVAMEVDGEIGGNDQTFNMLVGRDLLKQLKNKDKFVITTKLLTDSSGRKMGKTEGNAVSLDNSPEDMFGKIMSWSDETIMPGFELCSSVPYSELEKIKKSLEEGDNPKDIKMDLAHNLVSIFYGSTKANKAKKRFIEVFGKKVIPKDANEIFLTTRRSSTSDLADKLVEKKIISSKSEWHRLMETGSIKTSENQKINKDHIFEKETDLKIGKHRFIKVKITN